IQNNVINPIISSFRMKVDAGVEVINYPQHIDMYSQFLKPIQKYETSPGLIEKEKAIIPEINYIENFVKKNYKNLDKPFKIKICVTGPIELYIKRHSFTIYQDMALNYAKSVNSFIKNSLRNNRYLNTSVISIDEPSFGYVDLINVNDDDLINIFDKSLEGINCMNQIHLHSLKRSIIPLKTKNVDTLTCEYASDNSNVISKQLLDKYDKFIRVGITRTNINSIMAEALDSGITYEQLKTYEGLVSLIDTKEQIKQNLRNAINHYRDRLRFIGPDCGLSGWKPPKLAFKLLKRTRLAIEETKEEIKV
ncbi:MAG: hypothetical protein R6W84_01470, partial [Promethearchaeia archaeon]